jgi:putative ABC transport system permease protein
MPRRWLSLIRLRFRSLFRSRTVDRELERELAFHLEQQIEEYVAAGMTHEEAACEARRGLGGWQQIKEECRDMRRVHWIEHLVADIGYAICGLRHNPAFALTAMLSLALGIGANTAIFSLMEALLLRPLPYAEPGQLQWITETSAEMPQVVVVTPEFAAWRAENSSFSGMAAWNDSEYNLTGNGQAERLSVALVNAGFFRVLGVLHAREGFHAGRRSLARCARSDPEPGVVAAAVRRRSTLAGPADRPE